MAGSVVVCGGNGPAGVGLSASELGVVSSSGWPPQMAASGRQWQWREQEPETDRQTDRHTEIDGAREREGGLSRSQKLPPSTQRWWPKKENPQSERRVKGEVSIGENIGKF